MRATVLTAVLSTLLASPIVVTSSLAATFVYVSNAEDGDIGVYTLNADGSLKAGERVKAEKLVMPMTVTPDKRFLIAAVRQKPFQAMTFAIDPSSGALKPAGSGTLADSYPYISLDKRGRFLFGASYGGHQIGVNPVGANGKVGEPLQVIPTARNAHSIRIDNTNRFVFVPHLGTDQIFQFTFDEASGRLAANTPPVVQMKQNTGPRHLIVSGDNRFAYLLNELTATVTTLALDGGSGLLKELEFGLDPAAGHEARSWNAAGCGRDARGEPGAARHIEGCVGRRPASDAERPLSLRLRAHIEHAGRLPG